MRRFPPWIKGEKPEKGGNEGDIQNFSGIDPPREDAIGAGIGRVCRNFSGNDPAQFGGIGAANRGNGGGHPVGGCN